MGRKHNAETRCQEALAAIQKIWGNTGMSPTLREIGEEINVESTSQVRFYVDKLEKQGKIKRNDNKSRNILIIPSRDPSPAAVREKKIRILPPERSILDIPNFGPIAAGIPLHLPDASFKKIHKNHGEQAVVHIPESYLPAGVKVDDVFALYVEGDSMRDAMLTNGDIVIVQRTSIANVRNGDIVVAWIIDTQETTLKRFEKTERGLALKPENPNYKTLFFQPDEVDIQGKLLAVLRFRY